MGDVGADEGDVCVCVGGGYVVVAMCGGSHVMVVVWLLDGMARGCGGVYVLVVVV
jgi:hypothetical protein